jgi:hypothetical protein
MAIVPFENIQHEYFYMKTNYLKNLPLVKTNKTTSIYFHNCIHQDMCTIWSYFFKNISLCRTNLKFGHEYILNSYQYYDLIIINDFIDGETINHAFIDRFIDILNKHGELWVFCISEDTYNKITTIFDKYKKKYYQKDLSKEGIFLYMVTIGK